MVTQGLSVECTSCQDGKNTRRLSTNSRTEKSLEELMGLAKIGGRANSSSSVKENSAARAEFQRSQGAISGNSPTVKSPGSPRVNALQGANGNRRDSSFRKTYDENDKKRAIPCENCALTMPKKRKDAAEAEDEIDADGPILRTRKPFELVARARPTEDDSTPPKSTSSSSSSSSDSDTAATSHPRRHSRANSRSVGTSSSTSSFTSRSSHTHYLDYTSTHEPLKPDTFSLIRQACLRTLSCETLPPSSNPAPNTPTSPFSGVPSGSSPLTSSGGAIWFGDAQAGYTTAYIFRIPDPNARGRRRVYALMAITSEREVAAMQSFDPLRIAFKNLATWIQRLAEDELEKNESASSPRTAEEKSYITPTSSFLSSRSRGSDSNFAGLSLKAKGLAELVGMPDFFLELHLRFVRMLIEMRVNRA